MLSKQDVHEAKVEEDEAKCRLEGLQEELQLLPGKISDPTELAIVQASLRQRISRAYKVWQGARSYRIRLQSELYIC